PEGNEDEAECEYVHDLLDTGFAEPVGPGAAQEIEHGGNRPGGGNQHAGGGGDDVAVEFLLLLDEADHAEIAEDMGETDRDRRHREDADLARAEQAGQNDGEPEIGRGRAVADEELQQDFLAQAVHREAGPGVWKAPGWRTATASGRLLAGCTYSRCGTRLKPLAGAGARYLPSSRAFACSR